MTRSAKQVLFLTGLFILSLSIRLSGQIPPGYYDAAAGKTGTALQAALHNIIKNHTSITYSGLWTAFQTTDDKPNGTVWDIYSDIPDGTPNGSPPYSYTFVTDQCGNYSGEGDCYNREHSWPSSWFNDQLPMYTDLFHIYPTDGYVNNKRSNYPYATVASASWTSQNGSKLGSCSCPGYTGTVFEPINAYKGDLARSYFYMATRYYTEDSGWPGSAAVTGSQLKPWALQLMLHWSLTDPVSQKETDRNNTVYGIQNNRNPFIDHPEYAYLIWGYPTGVPEEQGTVHQVYAYPNPAAEACSVDLPVIPSTEDLRPVLVSVTGTNYHPRFTLQAGTLGLDLGSVPSGIYFLILSSGEEVFHAKIVKE